MDKLGYCEKRGFIVILSNGASYTASPRDIRRLTKGNNKK
jgi:hypothetical protein